MVQATIKWLGKHADARYSYRPLDYYPKHKAKQKAHEHAMHYAAAVLQAMLDTSFPKRELVEAVAQEFFFSDEVDATGFYADWMRYRNLGAFEVCSHILPACVCI